MPIGDTAALTVLRDGRELTLPLTAEPPPETPARDTTLLDGRHPLAGAVVANLSPALIEETGYDGVRRAGVVVLEGHGRSPAPRLGRHPGGVLDGKGVGVGKSVAVLGDLGGRGIIKK